jgi:hypothetical protein
MAPPIEVADTDHERLVWKICGLCFKLVGIEVDTIRGGAWFETKYERMLLFGTALRGLRARLGGSRSPRTATKQGAGDDRAAHGANIDPKVGGSPRPVDESTYMHNGPVFRICDGTSQDFMC